jgi:AcrR family transcriptional regulator
MAEERGESRMPGDRGVDTERTPWGKVDRLRERMLRPGPQPSREEGARNQLERLYGAMVASVADKGYAATTVGDLLEISGVSRSSFYDLFRDKEDCFLATFDALLELGMAIVQTEMNGEGTLEERARRGMRKMLESVVLQPAAADLCFNHPYDLGPRGHEALEKAMTRFGEIIGPALAELTEREPLPPQMVRALLGGAQLIIQVHLRRGEERDLPDLTDHMMDWALSYEAPPVSLRLTGRHPREFESHPPAFVNYSQPERIVRALAAVAGERGYPAVTIAEIAARAQMSQATFYANFDDKEAALLATLDSAAAQAMAVMGPAARRSPDWPNALRAGFGALCVFSATEPDFARLANVEASAAGPKALAQRDRSLEQMRVLMKPGFMLNPDVPLFVADAIIGAVWGLFYQTIVGTGPQGMPEIAPLASYIALSPFIGAEAAAEVANGDGRGPRD